jgi:hypothetical protein
MSNGYATESPAQFDGYIEIHGSILEFCFRDLDTILGQWLTLNVQPAVADDREIVNRVGRVGRGQGDAFTTRLSRSTVYHCFESW